jgi:hypothetical protein
MDETPEFQAPKRKSLNKTEKLAAALLAIKRGTEWLIPEPLRSSGDAKRICAYCDFDHKFPRAMGGTNAVWNMDPKSKEEHKAKTKRDRRNIARDKRLAEKQKEFRRMLLAPTEPQRVEKAKHKAKWPKKKIAGWRRFDGSPVRASDKGKNDGT